MRLQSKLTLFSAVSKIVVVLLLIAVLPPLIHRVALVNTDKRLNEKKDSVLEIISNQGIGNFVAEGSEGAYGSYNLLKEEFISIEQIPEPIVVDTVENSLRKVENEIVEYRVLSLTFEVDGSYYLLEIGRSIDTIQESIETMQQYALYFLAAVILITVFIDLAFNKILLQPLIVIVRRLKKIGHPSTFTPKTINTTTSDFLYLNNAINDMMGQVQDAFQKEKEFIGNVSHELLTPISILQNRMENLLTDPEMPEHLLVKLVDNQKTLHRLKNIIQALLLISRIENEQYLKNEEVSLAALVNEVKDEIADRAEAKEVTLKIDLEDDWTLQQANYSLLFTMLFNVVSNAIKYNKPNGSITISGAPKGKSYELCITDTGVGIPQEHLPHIFNRFKRLQGPDNESHGLGLPIVQTVAHFHKVKLTVVSTVNVGTTFCFRFGKV
ncbi:HAMP domain-containing histidine kinase [Pontibacter sp. BT310]|uniref:histidine kinase n=1 Tax=Pontibacter populi TaxID=890055 RepID=A0ABS6X7H7_9BACT|nr:MULTISPECIES: HAMP domain-containing sensor histidine kinase [Pontibacter]MBJ6117107.1 HAMP domain-containing histidine kinase [Pontibacter sp. BT310]MBR0569531.1 HAMP domain-containing histidine kinase [Microvirga sp. STS03]MBW3363960.1 HAMP domain-containing histidine kinase [Pontibacter populi]